jgi:hypothetical protein
MRLSLELAKVGIPSKFCLPLKIISYALFAMYKLSVMLFSTGLFPLKIASGCSTSTAYLDVLFSLL